MTTSLEAMMHAFKPGAAVYQTPHPEWKQARRSNEERIRLALTEPGTWHINIRDVVASLVRQGVSDATILANAAAWTLPGYTVKQTYNEIAEFIDGARRKWGDRTAYIGMPQDANSAQRNTPSKNQFFSATQLRGKAVPQMRWLVEELVPQKTVTLLSGDGGTGKSLLALQLAVAVATGSSWIGRPVECGRVIYLTAEDDEDELHRRLDKILAPDFVDYDELGGLTLRSLVGESALLASDEGNHLAESPLFGELCAKAHDERPALIVIDTLADVYPGNENDRSKVVQFVGQLRRIALQYDCAVLLLSHPSLTGLTTKTGTSGSTAWNNSVRSRLFLSKADNEHQDENPDARVLTSMKSNYGRTGDKINLKWLDGRFAVDVVPTGLDAMAVESKAKRVFLKLLRCHIEQGRRVNANSGPMYAPTVFVKHPENEGINKNAFRDAMERLLHEGKIRVDTIGPPSRRTSHLALE